MSIRPKHRCSIQLHDIIKNISISVSVCLSVCHPACFKNQTCKFHHSVCTLPVAVAQSSSDGNPIRNVPVAVAQSSSDGNPIRNVPVAVAQSSSDGNPIRNVLSVLQITSRCHIIVCFVQFARWWHRGKSAISDCISFGLEMI